MANLRVGSTGDDVKRLQQQLVRNGYKLNVDGIYGTQTQNAVRQYQQAKGLTVDGIAGTQTQGALSAPRTTTPAASTSPTAADTATPQTQATTPPTPQSIAQTYSPTAKMPDLPTSDLPGAYQQVQDLLGQRPADYESPYQQRISELYDQITGRGPFQYDFNADPIYQMYKDQYIRGGQRAMQDTMANAAALTGGYGNSYASTAGNLAYQDYLTRLNGVLPDLYSQAYGRYQDEGNNLMQQMQMAQGLDDTDYGRYRDQLGQWNTDLNFAYDRANGLYDRAYQQYQDALAQSNYEREMAAKGVNLENSRAYQSVLNNALQLSGDSLGKYLDSMVSGGYITPEEAAYIRDVELAGGLLGTGGGSGGGSGRKTGGNYKPDTSGKLNDYSAQNNLGTSTIGWTADMQERADEKGWGPAEIEAAQDLLRQRIESDPALQAYRGYIAQDATRSEADPNKKKTAKGNASGIK